MLVETDLFGVFGSRCAWLDKTYPCVSERCCTGEFKIWLWSRFWFRHIQDVGLRGGVPLRVATHQYLGFGCLLQISLSGRTWRKSVALVDRTFFPQSAEQLLSLTVWPQAVLHTFVSSVLLIDKVGYDDCGVVCAAKAHIRFVRWPLLEHAWRLFESGVDVVPRFEVSAWDAPMDRAWLVLGFVQRSVSLLSHQVWDQSLGIREVERVFLILGCHLLVVYQLCAVTFECVQKVLRSPGSDRRRCPGICRLLLRLECFLRWVLDHRLFKSRVCPEHSFNRRRGLRLSIGRNPLHLSVWQLMDA